MEYGIKLLQAFVRQHQNNIIVVADKHTLQDCYSLLQADLPHFIVPYGEGYKNIDSCEYIWKKLTEMEATRHTILLCLGGGVLCDMGAFAAGCYQRGMKIALVPTSLLAMVDASVGGKNGVNFMGLKNFLGSFKEADFTFICPEFLATLPHSEKIHGYVEMLKHGLIADKSHYDSVKFLFLKDSLPLDEQLIQDSIAIKKQYVVQDFRDKGVRKCLNFGHTIGHAIESHSLATHSENNNLSHGVSVALGMLAEAHISTQYSGLSSAELHEISIVLQQIVSNLDEEIPSYEALLPYLQKDKKNNEAGINFSLLSSIGSSVYDCFPSATVIQGGLTYLRKLK